MSDYTSNIHCYRSCQASTSRYSSRAVVFSVLPGADGSCFARSELFLPGFAHDVTSGMIQRAKGTAVPGTIQHSSAIACGHVRGVACHGPLVLGYYIVIRT